MLRVDHISKGFDQKPVLRDIRFQLRPEETLVILGPSGCGKTTLLHLICGMQTPDSGQVTVNGTRVSRPTPDIALILQDFGLLPWKTLLQNVALGLKIQGVGRRERHRRALDLLNEMGLADRKNEYPAVLSGGEQQRVAIARAYASKPRLLLMDEPFSSLDAITREKLQDTLLRTWRDSSVPFLLVTHSVEEAAFLGKRIMILAGTPAEIKADFSNPGFGSPAYRQSREYYRLVRQIRQQMGDFW
jgi:ABC-type nitrate/sulfonate/bicarbonate transport system ATPase subunit